MSQAPGAKVPFNNPTSQAERAATLREMHSVVSPEAGGRFAQRMIEHINTRGPTLEYPRLPSGPWSQPQPPPEEPLGFSVEDMPVMGEPLEAEAAARLLSVEAAGLVSPLPGAEADLSTAVGNLAGSSPPTSAPQLPDVAAVTARPFSIGADHSSASGQQPAASPAAPASIVPTLDAKVRGGAAFSSSGSLTRRFG